MLQPNSIVHGDCTEVLTPDCGLQADLVFADPPFNIGYKYDVYHDRRDYDEYFAWTQKWMAACVGVLKPTGAMWVAIGDEYAAEVKWIGDRLGLHLRNWVIWHYTFGQNTKSKFARSHAHLFYWTKDPKNFTFNADAVRVPSARQTTYADLRANPLGKVPDDVWSISRVCGTFMERVEWHPCQMPEKILERIILAASSPGDLVLDPFSGSATTACVAARLGRQYFATDISADYVRQGRKRVEETIASRRPVTAIAEDPASRRDEMIAKGSAPGARKDFAIALAAAQAVAKALGGDNELAEKAALQAVASCSPARGERRKKTSGQRGRPPGRPRQNEPDGDGAALFK